MSALIPRMMAITAGAVPGAVFATWLDSVAEGLAGAWGIAAIRLFDRLDRSASIAKHNGES